MKTDEKKPLTIPTPIGNAKVRMDSRPLSAAKTNTSMTALKVVVSVLMFLVIDCEMLLSVMSSRVIAFVRDSRPSRMRSKFTMVALIE